mgnify:CR=1 FL=1
MGILRKLFTRKGEEKLTLKYDKAEKYWTVQKAGSILYLGTKEQCGKYLANHQVTHMA